MSERGSSKILSFFIIVIVAALTAWMMTRNLRSHQADNFSTENLQTRFMSYATTLSPVQRLQVVKLNQMEVFERKSEAHLFWDRLKLPDVVVRASVPVQYSYYVDLQEAWKFERQGDVIIVTAPLFKPDTPAPDISGLKFEVRQGSLFRNESGVALSLQNELTKLLEQRALNSRDLARDAARKQIAKIIQDWMQPQQKLEVKVQFADEQPTTTNN